MRVFICGQGNDLHICKKHEKPAKHIILSNVIQETIRFQICKFQESLNYYEKIYQKNCENFFHRCSKC